MAKRISISDAIRRDEKPRAASAAHLAADPHALEGSAQTLPVALIRLNPDLNPRKLSVGPSEIDALRAQAQAQAQTDQGRSVLTVAGELIAAMPEDTRRAHLERIWELARSIEAKGLLQPIVVVPAEAGSGDGARYQVEAGARRYLAHRLLARQTIHTMLRQRATSELESRLRALAENLQREDLTLAEELGAVAEVVALQEAAEPGASVDGAGLHALIHKSERTCRRYLAIVREPRVMAAVRAGEIDTLSAAEAQLRALSEAPTPAPRAAARPARRGAPRTKVTLGSVDNGRLVRFLLERALGAATLRREFAEVDWDDLEAVQAAWAAALKRLAAEVK